MGGAKGGELAAEITRSAIAASLRDFPPFPDAASVKRSFQKGWADAITRMKAEVAKDQSLKDMGACLTVAQMVQEGQKRKVVYAHAGDTRLYVVKTDGRLVKITRDQNVIPPQFQDRIDNARSQADIVGIEGYWQRRNEVANSIAISGSQPVIGEYEIQPDDLMLFGTSDGVTDSYQGEDLQNDVAEMVRKGMSSTQVVTEITNNSLRKARAGEFRSKPDDITAVAILLK